MKSCFLQYQNSHECLYRCRGCEDYEISSFSQWLRPNDHILAIYALRQVKTQELEIVDDVSDFSLPALLCA